MPQNRKAHRPYRHARFPTPAGFPQIFLAHAFEKQPGSRAQGRHFLHQIGDHPGKFEVAGCCCGMTADVSMNAVVALSRLSPAM